MKFLKNGACGINILIVRQKIDKVGLVRLPRDWDFSASKEFLKFDDLERFPAMTQENE